MVDSFFIGCPVEFKNLCLIYPPTVKQVLTETAFPVYSKALTLSQEDIEDSMMEQGQDITGALTPLEYLLSMIYNNRELEPIIKKGFYFFIHENVTFLYEQKWIIIGDISQAKSIKDLRTINEHNYFDFQNLLRVSMGDKMVEKPNPNEHPRIKAMKAKARYRDKIKAKQSGLSLKSTLAAICCMDFGLNPLNIGELSYAAVPILMRTYQEKERYHIDIASLQAGADKKKVRPKYWIRNLED